MKAKLLSVTRTEIYEILGRQTTKLGNCQS